MCYLCHELDNRIEREVGHLNVCLQPQAPMYVFYTRVTRCRNCHQLHDTTTSELQRSLFIVNTYDNLSFWQFWWRQR